MNPRGKKKKQDINMYNRGQASQAGMSTYTDLRLNLICDLHVSRFDLNLINCFLNWPYV